MLAKVPWDDLWVAESLDQLYQFVKERKPLAAKAAHKEKVDGEFSPYSICGSFSASLSTAASVELRDNCAYFSILSLDLTAAEASRERLLEADTLKEVNDLILTALGLVLNESPICPELPPELASLDPIYARGGPREIGDGGLGVLLEGSVDVSVATILDVLTVMQERGVIPGPP